DPRPPGTGRAHASAGAPVQGAGIDPARDARVFHLARYLAQGRYLQPGEYGALLGAELAELMGLRLGDPFTLIMRTPQGAFQAIDLEVVGLLEAPHPEVNSLLVYLPLDVAQEALGAPGAASEIDVRAAEMGAVPALLQRVARIPGVEVYSWRELARDFLQMSETERIYDTVMLALVFLIALVGVVNTVLLATLERTKEIGTLKAMGLTGREILFLFVAEAGFLGALGGAAGVAFAAATEFYLVTRGIDYSSLLQGTEWGYPFSGIIYGEWNPELMAVAFLSGIAVCLLASLLPARRAARLDAAVALRNL
ncbi:MAG: FtsX-like permease family protein, partial [Bacillota bacterium]|nr:FtsX-like permease family protein [Bacillota bacterium]